MGQLPFSRRGKGGGGKGALLVLGNSNNCISLYGFRCRTMKLYIYFDDTYRRNIEVNN